MAVYLAGGGAGFALLALLGVGYFFSPEFTDVGYRPLQPVPFSHRQHVGELGIDCRYCHASVEVSAVASVPPTQTCMNCHRLVGRRSEKLEAVRESFETGQPIRWVRVHKVPEFAHFDHSVHVAAGAGCASCHGDVSRMDEIMQVEPLSMGWCLDCHRDPDAHLGLPDARPGAAGASPPARLGPAGGLAQERHGRPPTDCTACHQ
ncbi:MAG: cytochrome c3 family protein [Acidobacteriota bacterium]